MTSPVSIRKLLPPLVLGAMLNPLNSTMLSTGLTQLTHSFGRDVSAGALLITPLYITAMIGQPLMGRLADLYSARRVNQVGLVLVLAAVLIGIFAPSFNWLIVSRVILGLGTSANYPSAIAILRRYYADRGTVMPSNTLGWISLGGQVSMVLGPVIGGVMTDWLGWKGIFLINIPLVVVTGWLSLAIPAQAKVAATAGGERRRFAMLSLFKERPMVGLIYLQSAAAGFILYLTLYGLPQWLENVQRWSPSATGLILLPMSVVAGASALLISRKKLPALVVNMAAVVSAVLGSMALFVLHAESSLAIVIAVTTLMGLAIGINPIANQISLNIEAPEDLSGIAFGLFRTFVYIGAISSGAVLKIIFHKGVTMDSYRQICWYSVDSALILIILYIPLLLGRRRRKEVDA